MIKFLISILTSILIGLGMAVDLMAMISQITRIEQGDLDIATFKALYGME